MGKSNANITLKKETVINNFKLTSNFIEKLKEPDEVDIERDWGKNKVKVKKKIIEKDIKIFAKSSYYWKNIDHKIVEDYLSSFTAHEASKFQPKEMSEYIKNAVKKNMLTNWNVALIGNGSSGLIEKIGGQNVNLAFRKPKNTFTKDKAAYGVIWDPNHEALDIDKKISRCE